MNMMFIIRNGGERPAGVEVKLRRRTPDAATVDWFVLGDPAAVPGGTSDVVVLHDGWYPDDAAGGVVIFGPYWEIRETPFTVREVAPDPAPATPRNEQTDELVNVRKAIFGA